MSLDYKVFDTLLDAVIVVDRELGVHYANTAASIICNVSVKRFKGGKPLTQFIEFSGQLTDDGQLPASESTTYRELGFRVSSAGKQGFAQVSAQPDLSTVDDSENASVHDSGHVSGHASGARWILFIRDVSLEKALHDKYKGELDQKEHVISDLQKARAELENYSKNLESMVAERTLQLNEKTETLAAILDSLDQGILVFDSKGKCLPFSSRVCRDVLETQELSGGQTPIAGSAIASVLRVTASERGSFDQWIEATFSDMLPFEDIAGLGPSRFAHGKGREIQLTYNEMRGADKTLKGVVVVATDKTNEVEARKEAARERAAAHRILRILKHRTQFRSFAVDAKQMLERLQIDPASDKEQSSRDLHTIKGASASFAMTEIAALAHEAEQSLIEDRPELKAQLKALHESFLQFLVDNVDLYGGLQSGAARAVEIPTPTLYHWLNELAATAKGAELRQSFTEQYLKIPLHEPFAAYDDMIKELSERLQKQVAPLRFSGGELRVIPEPYNELWNAYTHVFRNALDHGIETPDVRMQAGKPAKASIEVSFEPITQNDRRYLRITVSDDGAGANIDRIRAKLEEHPDLLKAYEGASDQKLLQVIFEASFSTGQNVTDLSGRGVGLSALKHAAEELGGTAVAYSKPGQGMKIQVIVPEIEAAQAFAATSKAAKKSAA